jgi:hypothetical protein
LHDGSNAVVSDRNKLAEDDPVLGGLGRALAAWAASRDPRALRRALIAVLAALDDLA